jgi:hypothetical protein
VKLTISRAAAADTEANDLEGTPMPRVESSVMTYVDYNEHARELDIVFVSGKRYRYLDVPRKVYAALLKADSKGEFFDDEIRDSYLSAEVTMRKRRLS